MAGVAGLGACGRDPSAGALGVDAAGGGAGEPPGEAAAGEGCSTAGGVGAAAGAGVGAAMMRTPRESSPGPVRSLPAHAGRTSAAAIAGARTRRTIRFDLAGRVIAVLRAR
jgi:hypothetical protein